VYEMKSLRRTTLFWEETIEFSPEAICTPQGLLVLMRQRGFVARSIYRPGVKKRCRFLGDRDNLGKLRVRGWI
jgi:hypothetical protein